MYTIYKATNLITGKSYIGFDRKWPYRKTAHKCAAKRGSNLVFHNAIRTYGWENFEWTVIEQSEDRETLLNEREEFYIRKFNCHYLDGQGYNMTYGGEATLGWKPSEETKKKISESNLGRQAWNKNRPSPWTTERNIKSKGVPKPGLQKTYSVVDPSGKTYQVKGLKKFCKDHNLNAGNMCSVAKGKLKHYKQWYCQQVG